MTPSILNFTINAFKDKYIGEVIEIGSFCVNGSIRYILENRAKSYTGIDIVDGPGVDYTTPIQDITNTYDTVICCETLEHTINPWEVVIHLHRLVKPNGLLLVSTPTYHFPIHRYPIDCYRFGEDAYRLFIFNGFKILNLATVKDEQGFEIICCLGQSVHTT